MVPAKVGDGEEADADDDAEGDMADDEDEGEPISVGAVDAARVAAGIVVGVDWVA